MTYRAHINGFTGHFDNLDALKVWANGLIARGSMTGKPLQIWKAVWVAKDGSGAQYRSAPCREIVIGA